MGRKCFNYKGESKISGGLNSHEKIFLKELELPSEYGWVANTQRGEENNDHHEEQGGKDFC